jgi:HD-like signal output (HDOD) protein
MITTRPLLEEIEEFAVAHHVTLPVFSDLTVALRTAAANGIYNIEHIEEAIDKEPALATAVLRAANSAFFGGLSEIRTIRPAILRLGLKQITNLVVLATEKNRYTAADPGISALLGNLWSHTSACALASEWIARRLRYHQICEEVFIGGLVHDIGKLFLLRVLDEMGSTRQHGQAVPLSLVEEVLAQAHADQGYRLLVAWHLPGVYVTIVRDHHAEPVDVTNVPLLVVRLANQACNKVGLGLHADPSVVLPATTEALTLGMNDVSLAELEIILEDVRAAA